jgi:hypothetical protein
MKQARAVAWDSVVEHERDTTGATCRSDGPRTTRESASDFDAFYAQRPERHAFGGALLVASSDGCTDVAKGAREATRKAAEADRAAALHGDPMAQRSFVCTTNVGHRHGGLGTTAAAARRNGISREATAPERSEARKP